MPEGVVDGVAMWDTMWGFLWDWLPSFPDVWQKAHDVRGLVFALLLGIALLFQVQVWLSRVPSAAADDVYGQRLERWRRWRLGWWQWIVLGQASVAIVTLVSLHWRWPGWVYPVVFAWLLYMLRQVVLEIAAGGLGDYGRNK